MVAIMHVVAVPAWADPPGPTHYQSSVISISVDGSDGAAAATGVEFSIVGGDAYFVARVAPGVRLDVPGYDGEPYLRFSEDGTVEVNERSPAHWLNDARYGAADANVPVDADPDAPPLWRTVGDDGEYAWHDHRIHFMSPQLPRHVDSAAGTEQHVMDWQIPMRIDQRDVVVEGELVWHPSPGVGSAIAIVLVALGGAGLLVARRLAGAGVLVAAGSAGAFVVGTSFAFGLPSGADADPALPGLPVVAAVLGVAGLLLGRTRARVGETMLAIAGVPLIVWSVALSGALYRPIVPSALPTILVQAGVALGWAAGVGALVAGAIAARRMSD